MYYSGYPQGMSGNAQPQRIPHPVKELHHATMRVEGEGEVFVKPDQAKLSLGIITENMSVEWAQRENTANANRVLEALKSLGIDEGSIKTTVYNIQPQYDFIDGKSVLRGYQVEHFIDVTVKDIAQVGAVYDVAVRNGVNQTGNIQFIVANPDVYYREALKLAVLDAWKKAQVIAETIGVTLNRTPMKVVERAERRQEISPFVSLKAVAADSAQQPPQIQKGELSIHAYVTAVFEYKSRA